MIHSASFISKIRQASVIHSASRIQRTLLLVEICLFQPDFQSAGGRTDMCDMVTTISSAWEWASGSTDVKELMIQSASPTF